MCKFEILIKFKDQFTEFSLFQILEDKIHPIESIYLSPQVYGLKEYSFSKMNKQEFKDFLAIYIYQTLTRLLRQVPDISDLNMVIIAEGEFYQQMDDEVKKKFLKAILALQNIDDRFVIAWNNIRIINKNEKNIQDYLLMKNVLKDNNTKMASLNLNSEGASLISSEPSNSGNTENLLSSPVKTDSLNVQNDDSNKMKKGNGKESLVSKDMNILNFHNLENSLLKSMATMSTIKKGRENENIYEPSFRSVGSALLGEEVESELKYEKYLSDPVFLNLENYLDKNSLAELSREEENSMVLNNVKDRSELSSSGLIEEDINFLEKSEKKQSQEEPEKNEVKDHPCFNKGYYDLTLNIRGTGDYHRCYLYIASNQEQGSNSTFPSSNTSSLITTNNKDNSCNQTIRLEGRNRKFKFLFYSNINNTETGNKNEFRLQESQTFSQFKEKVKDVCTKSYNYITTKYRAFNVKNIYKLCYDSTYFVYSLTINGAKDSTLLSIQSHISTNSSINSNINTGLTTKAFNLNLFSGITKHKLLTALFLLSSLIAFVSCVFGSKLTSWILNTFPDKIDTNKHVTLYLSYHSLRTYLFYEEDAHFKVKYGKDFKLDERGVTRSIEEDAKVIITSDEKAQEIIKETSKFVKELKLSLALKITQIFLLSSVAIVVYLLVSQLYSQFGAAVALEYFVVSLILDAIIIGLLNIALKVLNKESSTEKPEGKLQGKVDV